MSRADNRASMPTVAKFVDHMRAVFGICVRVTYACENGKEVGVRGPEGVNPVLSLPDVGAESHRRNPAGMQPGRVASVSH
jgi:hypothetical protein